VIGGFSGFGGVARAGLRLVLIEENKVEIN